MAEKKPKWDVPTTHEKKPEGEHYEDLVTIEVGQGQKMKSFMVHKGLICFYSEYFRGCFNGSFKESIDKTSVLDTEDPDIFKLFKDWLYTQKLGAFEKTLDKNLDWSAVCRLWIFADKHLIPLLQNDAIDSLIKKQIATRSVPVLHVKLVYENTSAKSFLRKCLIDLCVFRSNPDLMLLDLSHWNMDALSEYTKKTYLHGSNGGKVRAMNNCDYHTHEGDYKCPPLTKTGTTPPAPNSNAT